MSVVGDSSAKSGPCSAREAGDRRRSGCRRPRSPGCRTISGIREAEGVAQPEVARRLDALAVPGGADLGLVDQVRADDVGVPDLVAAARTRAVGRHRRQRARRRTCRTARSGCTRRGCSGRRCAACRWPASRGGRCPAATRTGCTPDERRVVGRRRVGERRRPALHRAVDVGDRAAVGGDAALRDDVARERLARHRVAQHAIVGGADDAVGAAQAEREVAVQFGRRRQRLQRRVGEAVDRAVLLAAEEEQLVAQDRPAERAFEVAELERRLGAVAVGVARREVVRRSRTSRRGSRSARCRGSCWCRCG